MTAVSIMLSVIKKNMNCDLLFYLFNDFIGGADDDDMSKKFLNLDLNDDDSLHKFIQHEIKPSFEAKFSLAQKEELNTLLSKLESDEIELSANEFNNQLFPFEIPNNLHSFYKSIKNVLFGQKLATNKQHTA